MVPTGFTPKLASAPLSAGDQQYLEHYPYCITRSWKLQKVDEFVGYRVAGIETLSPFLEL